MKITGFFCQNLLAAVVGLTIGIYGCSSSQQQEDQELEADAQQESAEFDSTDPSAESAPLGGDDGFADDSASLESADSLESAGSDDFGSLSDLAEEASSVAEEAAMEETTAAEEAPSGEIRYRVKRGDTLSLICQAVYGDLNMWRDAAAKNSLSNPDLIYPGNVITLDVTNDASRSFQSTYTESSASASGSYRVRSGDTLADIAEAQYGDRSKWRTIYEMNRDQLRSPHRIYTGQVLNLTAH